MKAPSRGSSSFKDEIINEFLKQDEFDEDNVRADFFLRLRDDPNPNRCIDKIWKKLVDGNPSIDSALGRELFLRELADPWDIALLADNVAGVKKLRQTWQAEKIKTKKALARSISKTSSTKELLALLHNASTKFQQFARFEEFYEGYCQNELYPLIDVRSPRAGSRNRTVFMRVASDFMRRITGEWHDDWVAELTDIAFPPDEDEDVTSIDMVRSARRGVHP
jgi:hypothetical protein